jgi:hypothetical protein
MTEELSLGEYHIELKGEKAILYDRDGTAVFSHNASSVDGLQVKRKIAKIVDVTDEEVDRVIAQLAEILCLRERERFKQQVEDGLRQAETHLTENEITEGATELLKSPDMLYRVKRIYDRGVMVDRYRFVLMEDDKKLLTFLIFLSAITSWSQSLWSTGSSGFGKSNMIAVTLRVMPPGYAKVRSYLTGAGLRYGNQDYKVLFIREWRQFAEQDIRLVSREDGSYTYEIAVRDPKTGEMTTQAGEIPAKTIVTTSAGRLPSGQMLRRCWLVSVDESPELTSLINMRKAEYRAGKVEPASPDEIAFIQRAILLLEPADVIIPYTELLVDLAPWDRTRFDYLLDIIAVIAWLHRYQRAPDDHGRIIATPADLYIAMRICWPTLMQSLTRLPERLRKCWEILPDEHQPDGVTIKELSLKLGVGQGTVRGYLADLENQGHAASERKQGSREKQYWRITARSAEVLNITSSSHDWQKIASLTEQTLKQSSLKATLNRKDMLTTTVDDVNQALGLDLSQELLRGSLVCDPISGKHLLLGPTDDSAQSLETAKKGSFGWKELDSGSLRVLNRPSTVQHLDPSIRSSLNQQCPTRPSVLSQVRCTICGGAAEHTISCPEGKNYSVCGKCKSFLELYPELCGQIIAEDTPTALQVPRETQVVTQGPVAQAGTTGTEASGPKQPSQANQGKQITLEALSA